MAIDLEILEFSDVGRLPGKRIPVPELPPVKARRITAAGLAAAFSAGAKVFTLKNRGDTVFVRANTVSPTETTQAATGDDKSLKIAGGESIDFMLPDKADPTNFKLDVR